MSWELTNDRPIYMQLMDYIKLGIISGQYPAGSKLPSVRELASIAAVNPNTMQKAFAQLEREGLLYSVRTSGRFVTEEKEVLDNLKKTLSKEYINELFDSLGKLGMSREEIVDAVKQWSMED